MAEFLTQVPHNSIKLPYEAPVLRHHQPLLKVTLGTVTPRVIPFQVWARNNPEQAAEVERQSAEAVSSIKLNPGEMVSNSQNVGSQTVYTILDRSNGSTHTITR